MIELTEQEKQLVRDTYFAHAHCAEPFIEVYAAVIAILAHREQGDGEPPHEHRMVMVDAGSNERLCSIKDCHYRTGSVDGCVCSEGRDSWKRCRWHAHPPADEASK